MSVIGRLDEQVDEVLITPLAKRDRKALDERVDEDAAKREEQQQPGHDQKSRGARDELPVWML